MTSSKPLRALAAFSLSLSLAGAALAAPPTPEDYATARALYKEGKERRAAGDLKGAFEKLKAAHALGRTPITGIELARTEEQLGMLVEARETCLDVVRMPVASDESERSAAAREDAAKLAAALRPRLGALRIHVTSSAPAIVTVDGENVPPAALGEPRLVDPGHHVITAHVDGGASVSASVDVTESQSGDVSLAPPPAPVETIVKPPPPPPPPERPKSHGLGVLTVSGVVVTSAGLAVGAIGGLVALVQSTDLKNNCASGIACSGPLADELGAARAAAYASTIGFSVAGIGVVLLVVGLVTHTSSSELRGLRIVPQIGLGQVGVSGAF